MKKLFNLLVITSAVYLGLILALSLVVTNERSLSFFSQLLFTDDLELKVKESKWHPTNPFLEIDELSLKSEEEYLSSRGIKIYFSLFNPFSESFLSNIDIEKTTYRSAQAINSSEGVDVISVSNALLKRIHINELAILNIDAETILVGRLEGSFASKSPSFQFRGMDGDSGKIDVFLSSKNNSNGNIIDGHITASNFLVESSLITKFCQKCDDDLILNTDIKFSLFDKKPIDLIGNLNIDSKNDILGIRSISSSFKLTDSDNKTIQVRSFLNKDKDFILPEFFLSLNDYDLEIFIPTLEIKNLRSFLELSNLNNMEISNLHGSLNEIKIKPYEKDILISGSFTNFGILSDIFGLKGVEGNFIYKKDTVDINLDAPNLNLDAKGLFDDILNVYDFKSHITLNVEDGHIQIPSAPFAFVINNEILNGSFSFDRTPLKSLGDISISLSTDNLSKGNAFFLFPNTSYLKATKKYLENLIRCGNVTNPIIFFRFPIDRKYDFSSSSFSLVGSSNDLCIELNGFDINQIEIDFTMQDFLFEGQVKEGNFYGSNLRSNISISQDKNYYFELEGNTEGPFSSLLKLLNTREENLENPTGQHQTNFFYRSPWNSINSLLDKESELIINTDIKRGSLNLSNLDLSFRNIFSKINYDSKEGIKDGFISLRINSIPLVFDLQKGKSENKKNLSVFSVIETINLNKFIPVPLNAYISGNSQTTIKLEVPSYVRDVEIVKPQVTFSSSLEGININLPEPFSKKKLEKIDLGLTYFPSFDQEDSRLNFKFGDKLRGKLFFSDSMTQGFLIAGKKKQSISIEDNTLSFIGSFREVDYRILELFDFNVANKDLKFEIKGLNIDRLVFGKNSLNNLSLKSINNDDFYVFEASNSQFQGKLFYPKSKTAIPLIDLDFINLNLARDNSSSSFLTLFNEINSEIQINVKKVTLNSHDYGNWGFDIVPGKERITFSSLTGKYNKWGLEKTKSDKSDLIITKQGFGWQTTLITKIYSGSPEKAFMQIGVEPNFEMDTIAMETNLSWNSLPWNFNYDQVTGEIELNIEGLLIEDSKDIQTPNNLLRLINIFNITDSFEKVTNLDFRKLYKTGFAADSVKGTIQISNNKILIDDNLTFKSGSSEFRWTGEISKNNKGNLEDINLEVVMTLPLQEYLPAYALILGGPVTAGVVYIAGKAFQRNLDKLSSGTWKIRGSLEDPKTDFEGWFEN